MSELRVISETALLKVTNDILMSMDCQHVTLLVMLDLSAAFDTVDHEILLNRLNSRVGVKGQALKWFASYLTNRSLRLSFGQALSEKFELSYGVPQGSCLGPLLYTIYASELLDIIEKHLPDAHTYADDTQLYLSFKPTATSRQADAIAAMEACIKDIRAWMSRNKLMLNSGKTELMITSTRQQLAKVELRSLHVGVVKVSSVGVVRNLGTWLDENINMVTHINKTCKASYFHWCNIRRIRKFLTKEATETLVHALIMGRVDYCNCLLFGLPSIHVSKLQRIQNSAARLVCSVSRYEHITPVLFSLHWLPVYYRIHFKILLFTFKAIHGMAPEYICSMIKIKQGGRYNLRSNTEILLQPHVRLTKKTLGDRAFVSAAHNFWNKLSIGIRRQDNFITFKKQLKTYFFKIAYSC